MFNVCPGCGSYRADKAIDACCSPAVAVCPECGRRIPFRRLPLLFLTGASGTGKTTLCRMLSERSRGVVALESDILWRKELSTPGDDYRSYREMWLRLCKNISQAGMPVLLCGCLTPEQIEDCVERRYFSATNYLALHCEPSELERRLRGRPAWRRVDNPAVADHLRYNDWIRTSGGSTRPPMELLDTTERSVEACAVEAEDWIDRHRHSVPTTGTKGTA